MIRIYLHQRLKPVPVRVINKIVVQNMIDTKRSGKLISINMKAKRVHIPLVQLRHAERPEGPPLDGPPRLRRPRLFRRRKGPES